MAKVATDMKLLVNPLSAPHSRTDTSWRDRGDEKEHAEKEPAISA
jgi:hypothetical protein